MDIEDEFDDEIDDVIDNEIDNEDNTFDTSKLEDIRISIENMPKHNQIEVLKILSEHNNVITLNENQYGTHINLTFLPQEIIKKLEQYIDYVNSQAKILNEVEDKKKLLSTLFSTNDNK